jgi:hypothetical protein
LPQKSAFLATVARCADAPTCKTFSKVNSENKFLDTLRLLLSADCFYLKVVEVQGQSKVDGRPRCADSYLRASSA